MFLAIGVIVQEPAVVPAFALVREAVALHKDWRSSLARSHPVWPLGLPGWDDDVIALQLDAGAEFAITQPVFDVGLLETFLRRIEHCRIPVEVDIASEFRYSDPIVDQDTVVLAISQSGETADTLAAMEEGRKRGAVLWSNVNAIGSQAMRIADGFISMQTGPEIGVASTKAFTAPLVDQYMLAILLADLRGTLDEKQRRALVADLRLIPSLAGRALQTEPEIEKVATATDLFPRFLAQGFALAGNRDESLRWLSVAIDRGFINYPFLVEHDPFFAPMRKERRFEELLRAAGRANVSFYPINPAGLETGLETGNVIGRQNTLLTMAASRTPTMFTSVSAITTTEMMAVRPTSVLAVGAKYVRYATKRLQLAANAASRAIHSIHPTSKPTAGPKASRA